MTGIHEPVFYQFDQSRTEESKNNYHLSLQISIDGFCFALFHLQERKYIGIGEYAIKNNSTIKLEELIQSVLESDTWLKGSFKSVSVSLEQPKNTLIPSALFDENQLNNYLSINTGKYQIEGATFDLLLQTETVNCYEADKDLCKLISRYHPAASFSHQTSVSIESAAQVAYKGSTIHLQFNRTSIDLTAFKEGKLQLQNRFNYKTSEDVIYYLLYVMEQLSISQEETLLSISGNIVKDSNVYQLLYKYIKEIKLVELPTHVDYSQPLRLAEPHQYYLLIQQYLCA